MKIFSCYLLSALSAFAAANVTPTPFLTTKVMAIDSGPPTAAGGKLLAKNNSATSGTLINIGAGVFDLGSNKFFFKSGITYAGQGIDSTILNGTNITPLTMGPQFVPLGNCVVRDLTIRTRDNNGFHYSLGRTLGSDGLCTNAVFQRIRIHGDTDCFFYGNANNESGSIEFRDCKFDSGWDTLVIEGSTNFLASFVNCEFNISVSGQTNTQNGVRNARFLVVNTDGFNGCNARFKNCTFRSKDELLSALYYEIDAGIGDVRAFITYDNCSWFFAPTNGAAIVQYSPYYSLMVNTNMFVTYQGCYARPEILVSGNRLTNGPGPQIVLMNNAGLKTNTLPRISYLGVTNFIGVEITVVDSSGTAAANNLQIEPQEGLINGAARFTISANFGSATVRNVGTNWEVIARAP